MNPDQFYRDIKKNGEARVYLVNSAWLSEEAPLAARVRTIGGESEDVPEEFRDYDKVFSEKLTSILPN